MKKPTRPTPNLKLKQARVRQGWSQEYVAQAVGTDAFTVSRWERGVTIPSAHFRPKLSELFSLSITELGLMPPEKAEASSPAPPPANEQQPVFTPIFDPAIPAPPAGELGLVGRDELLRQLKERLLNEKRVAISALNGLPGVGKTALATALAHDSEARTHFSGGILWAGLGRQPDIPGLLSHWGALLNCIPANPEERSQPESWAKSIHAAIGQQPFLLIIDDAWDLAHALAFQVGGPRCAYIVTTRFPEIARRFAVNGATVVRELEEADGRLLLMRLAPAVVEAEPEEAQALVAAVGGLPLALTLLGNYLRAQSHSGQPRRLRAALERLRHNNERLRLAEPQALIGSHPSLSVTTPLSLQAVISLSDQQISEEARTTLRSLAVFPPRPNTFSEEAAIAVSARPVETLDELSDAGLLESSGPARYTLHQTISDYAHVHLSDPQAAARLASYFIAYTETNTAEYPILDRENSNILAALEIAFAQNMRSELIRGVLAFAPFLVTRGLYGVAEAQLRRSLAAAENLENARGQIASLLHLGKIAMHRGEYAQAQSIWQNALHLANESGQQEQAAQILLELGGLAWKQGEMQEAHQFLNQALAMPRQNGDERRRADALKTLGNIVAEQGQPQQARQFYEEALQTFQQLADQRGAAIVQHNLAILEREEGHPQQARQLYMEALQTFRQLGDLHSSSVVLGNLGHLARQQGQPQQARQFFNEALTIQRQVGNRGSLAFTILNLASLEGEQEKFARSQELLYKALQIFQELKEQRNIAMTLQTLGCLQSEQGNFEQAQQFLDDSLHIFQELEDQWQIALTYREQGTLERARKNYTAARTLYNKAIEILTRLEARHELAMTRLELGVLAREQGNLEEARRILDEGLATVREIKDRRNIAHALADIGILLLQQGQEEEALPALLSAAIGLELVETPRSQRIKALIEEAQTHIGETTLRALASRLANETPEPAYELTPAEWVASIQRLLSEVQEYSGR